MIGWGHVSFEWLGGAKWTFGQHIANLTGHYSDM